MNPESFNQVMARTENLGDRLRISGEHFPGGKGLELAFEGKVNASVADQWHKIVRDEYERQKEQADATNRPPPAHQRSGGGGNPTPGDSGASGRPATGFLQGFEEELLDKREEAWTRRDRIEVEHARLTVELRELDEYIESLDEAIRVVGGRLPCDDQADEGEPYTPTPETSGESSNDLSEEVQGEGATDGGRLDEGALPARVGTGNQKRST